jgi:hypothetical protein
LARGGQPESSSLTLAETWNGSAWAPQSIPNPAGAIGSLLLDVSCTSAVGCTAVGSTEGSAGVTPLAASWDGTAWAKQPVPAPSGSFALNGVSCIAATQCTAVGGGDGLAEVWNGTDWTTQATANPTPNKVFDGISCTGPGTRTAVGDSSQSLSGHETLPLTEHE